MPLADLRTRLQHLGVRPLDQGPPLEQERPVPEQEPPLEQGPVSVAQTQPPPAAPSAAGLPGRELVTPHGAFQLIEARYASAHAHGHWPLANFLQSPTNIAAQLARAEALAQTPLHQLGFVDTETTGLAGGAGTLAFLVGVGLWEGDHFCVRQYFLRDPGEEEGMLRTLTDDLAPCGGWVTFNGKTFDLPLLDARYTMNRLPGPFSARPNLDLLTPARRLYKGRLPSCALHDLETHALGVVRNEADVPGELIPQMYADYLRTGDSSAMHRILYHNVIDILSMVTLAAHLLTTFAGTPKELPPQDLLRLALWHDDRGRATEAETAYMQALAQKLPLADRRVALTRYAALLKRQDRRAEAAPLWEQLASFTLDDPAPFVELSKFYEWHARDLHQALLWAQRALAVAEGQPKGWQRDEAVAEVQHRVARLQTKQ